MGSRSLERVSVPTVRCRNPISSSQSSSCLSAPVRRSSGEYIIYPFSARGLYIEASARHEVTAIVICFQYVHDEGCDNLRITHKPTQVRISARASLASRFPHPQCFSAISHPRAPWGSHKKSLYRRGGHRQSLRDEEYRLIAAKSRTHSFNINGVTAMAQRNLSVRTS